MDIGAAAILFAGLIGISLAVTAVVRLVAPALAGRPWPSPGLAGPRRAVQHVHVRVRGSFEPDTIPACAGWPLRITFHREETAACSEHVIFPDLGKSVMLPAFEDVTVELRLDRVGEYAFTCQMGVLRGRVLAQDRARPSAHVFTGSSSRLHAPSIRRDDALAIGTTRKGAT